MGFTTKYIATFILLLNFVSYGNSTVKIWKYDTDIHNPSNWVGGKAQDHCDGLDLSEHRYSVIVLDDLNIKKIILPPSGILGLTDEFIEFNEHSTSIMNCVRIKELIEYSIYWLNPGSWIIQGDDTNVAIPHSERVPCKDDDVIFPKGFKSGYCIIDDVVEVKSFKFGADYLTHEDLENDMNLVRLFFLFPVHNIIDINEKGCTDPTGCVCRPERTVDFHVCTNVDDPVYFRCLNPIKPLGFCTKMCGAYILLKPKTNFQISDVRRSLKRYSSDTYVSKVYNKSVEVIQVIFAEKQYSGLSLDEARDYLSQLLADETIEAKSVELYSSGPYFVEGKTTRNVLSVVFGSLCGVTLIFAILFLIYSPRFAALNLRNRFFLLPRSLTSFKSNVFARYDNNENAELISSAESMANLDKSFDNPMFGKSISSMASTSYGTTYTPDEKATISEISLENAMYEINNLDEIFQEATKNHTELIEKEK